MCDPPLLARLRDKQALYAGLAGAGLPVLAPCRPPVDEPALPLIGKPRHGWGGRGVVVARTRPTWRRSRRDERESRVWQPFLEGAEEISADFAIRRDGEVPRVGLRLRVRTAGGFAVVSDTVEDAEVESLVRRFAAWAAARGGRGLFNVQLLRRGEARFVSDVNPRLGTSAVHWRGSGFNPVLVLCAEAGIAPAGRGRRGAAGASARSATWRSSCCPRGRGARRWRGSSSTSTTRSSPRSASCASASSARSRRSWREPERDRALREGLRLVEEGPRDRLIDALAEALGWGPERRDELLRRPTAPRGRELRRPTRT